MIDKLLRARATASNGTRDYDFAANDCKNLINSTKKWLKMEDLI